MPAYLDEGGAVYNVKAPAYGIHGDNTNNDAQMLQVLLDLIANNGGGVAYFPPNPLDVNNDPVPYLLGLTDNLTQVEVPESVTIHIAQGAILRMFDATNGPTRLNLMGRLECGRYRMFHDISESPEPLAMADTAPPEVMPEWFGARAANFWTVADGLDENNVPDSTLAIKAAVACLPLSGGVIRFSPGQYGLSEEVVIDRNGVLLQGGPRQGPLNNQHNEYGSMLVLKGAITGSSMVRFTAVNGGTGVASWGCGVRGMSFCDFNGAQRSYECEAALHVEKCIAFTLDDCTFSGILGAALKVTSTTQSQFVNAKIMRCGAVDRPAVWLEDGSNLQTVQGSVFSGFKVELCYDTTYFYVGENNPANKFENIGFEADPTVGDSFQTYMRVRGERNLFGKMHFNRNSEYAKCVKLSVEASRCQFGELSFMGRSGIPGSLHVTSEAEGNLFDSVSVQTEWPAGGGWALPVDWDSLVHIHVEGKRNQIGKIVCDQFASRGAVGRLTLGGAYNQVGELIDTGSRGVLIAGKHNKLLSFISHGCPETALTVAGTACEVLQADIEECGVKGGPALLIEDPYTSTIPVGWNGNRSRVRARVVDAVYAEEGLLVTATEVFLLPGTLVEDIPNGHGIRWTGIGGGWNGIEVFNVGKDGIFVEGGSPASMTDWTVRCCNTNFRDEHHGGFHATVPLHTPMPATCTGFLIREDGSTHAYSFKIEPAGTSGAAYSRWLIRGNVAGGGQVEIPAADDHSVDFDSDGMGDDIPTNITKTIALGDTANFFSVTGTDDIETITASWKGRKATLRLDPGAGNTVTLKKGVGNLLLASDFVADPNDTLCLISNGTQWLELGRSVN